MSKRKPSMGRPPGSPNREYEFVVEYPAQCPHCQSTKLTVVKGFGPDEFEFSGTDAATGRTYDRVVKRRKRCECGQLLNVKTYEKETNPVR